MPNNTISKVTIWLIHRTDPIEICVPDTGLERIDTEDYLTYKGKAKYTRQHGNGNTTHHSADQSWTFNKGDIQAVREDRFH